MIRISRREWTPVGTRTKGDTSHLPSDVIADQAERLKLFALVCGSLWLLASLMEAWVIPRFLNVAPSPAAILISCSAVVTAIAVRAYLSYPSGTLVYKADSGLWLMVFNAIHIALLETWARNPLALSPAQPSWTMMAILLTAVSIPTAPHRMIIAALVAASMGPLAIGLASLVGQPVPTLATTAIVYLPNYLWAIAAVTPSVVFQRFGRRLREARELGSYELVEQLGAGGMGEVWRARHRLLAREAAIKLVRPEVLGADTGSQARLLLRRFEREAQATAQLSSAHSIRLFDFGTTDDERFYYVMELLVGRDLETFVKEFGAIPFDRTMFLLRQICHSLAEAHAGGLIHRDIKPANIYVCRMGLDFDFVKVLDFGLVTFHANSSAIRTQTALTTVETTMGTPAYMAPEVILGHQDIDRRADVYALGCVAYFMLTGERVFEADSSIKALIDHVQTVPTPPSKRSPLPVPSELDAIVMSCLEKDPDRRPQDAAQLRRMLEACQTPRSWNSNQAGLWWRSHLPSLAGPLAFVSHPA